MSKAIRLGMLVVLTAFLPADANAFGILNPFDSCGVCAQRPWMEIGFGFPGAFASPGCGGGGCGQFGNRCCAPPAPYNCGPGVLAPNPLEWRPTITPSFTPSVPAPVPTGPSLPPSTSWNSAQMPVCATALQPQHVTTYRNVPTVQYRREAYVENVPVTVYQQVTVPRQVYQPQTRYRDVAYTVNQTMAETRTQYVPQPIVSYVPTTPIASSAFCDPCGDSYSFGLTPQFVAPEYPSTIATLPSVPYVGATLGPVPAPIALPETSTTSATPAATLQPPQYSADDAGSWQTVPQRQAHQRSGVEQMGGLLPSYAPPARPASLSRSREARRGMFQPAPSAATVWQSRWMH